MFVLRYSYKNNFIFKYKCTYLYKITYKLHLHQLIYFFLIYISIKNICTYLLEVIFNSYISICIYLYIYLYIFNFIAPIIYFSKYVNNT